MVLLLDISCSIVTCTDGPQNLKDHLLADYVMRKNLEVTYRSMVLESIPGG